MSSVFPGLELGDEVSEVMHADNCSVLKIENETGEGIMTCYMLFPGLLCKALHNRPNEKF